MNLWGLRQFDNGDVRHRGTMVERLFQLQTPLRFNFVNLRTTFRRNPAADETEQKSETTKTTHDVPPTGRTCLDRQVTFLSEKVLVFRRSAALASACVKFMGDQPPTWRRGVCRITRRPGAQRCGTSCDVGCTCCYFRLDLPRWWVVHP